MRSLLLAATMQILIPLLLLFSLFLLFRGHNAPGGGFVGGLVAAAGFALYALAVGEKKARLLLRIEPRLLITAGLATAAGSGLISLVAGRPFLTGLWSGPSAPLVGTIGTPLLFDAGVYLLVAGVTLLIIFTLLEE